MNKNVFRSIPQVIVGFGCALILLTILPSPVSSRPRIRHIDRTWESLMGNQLFQAYYCVGLVGDLYRAKVYSKSKTLRVSRLLQTLLKQERLFASKVRIGRGKKQKALFRHIKATIDLLLLALQSLEQTIQGKMGAKVQRFLQYRNAAAQDLQKLLRHRGLKRRRRYGAGRRRAMGYLNKHLGPNLAYGYLLVGLIADGYFQLVLNQARVKEYLGTHLKLLQSGITSLNYLRMRLKGPDRSYVEKIRRGMLVIYQAGVMLGQFSRTRKRGFLQRYQILRRQAWQHVQPLAR